MSARLLERLRPNPLIVLKSPKLLRVQNCLIWIIFKNKLNIQSQNSKLISLSKYNRKTLFVFR